MVSATLSAGCTITTSRCCNCFPMTKPIHVSKIISHVDKVIETYSGDAKELEQAIGVWILGRRFGWRVILLIHDRKTLAKYEKILGIEFRNELPEIGDLAEKSVAWKAVKKVSNFWKAVRGEITGIRSPAIK